MTCQERASLASFISFTSLPSPKRMQLLQKAPHQGTSTWGKRYLAYCMFWRWPVAGTKLGPQQPHIYQVPIGPPHSSAVTSMLVLAS